MTTFILWRIWSGRKKGEIFHTQVSLCSILGNTEWNRSLNSFASVMKKKMSTNAITCCLKGWVNQSHQRNVLSIRRTYLTPHEEIKSFKFTNFMHYKLPALLIKSLSNPSVSSEVPTAWKFDSFNKAVLKMFERTPNWKSVTEPPALIKF